jgi:hypothetical protein
MGDPDEAMPLTGEGEFDIGVLGRLTGGEVSSSEEIKMISCGKARN